MKENLLIDMDERACGQCRANHRATPSVWGERALNGGESNQPTAKCPRIPQNLHSFGDLLTSSTLHPELQPTEVLVRDIKSLAASDACAETRERRGGYRRVTAGDLFDIAEPIPPARVRSVESMLLMEIAGMREN